MYSYKPLKKKKEVKSELSQHGHNNPPIPFLRLSELGKHLTPHTDFLRFSPKKVGKETGCGNRKQFSLHHGKTGILKRFHGLQSPC